jgi:hypothetical protein
LQQSIGFACDALASNNLTVAVQTGFAQLSSICYRFTPIFPATKLRAFP